MINESDIQTVIGRQVVGSDGDSIGKAGQVFLDDATGRPEWVTVETGLFGTKQSFVPLADAEQRGDELAVPYDKAKVKDAPRVDVEEGHLSEENEAELYRYYGIEYSQSGSDTDLVGERPAEQSGRHAQTGQQDVDVDAAARSDALAEGRTGTGERETVGHDTSGPTTDDAMTRSEERLNVGTEKREAGRARLRKYVVTEEVTTTVPVTREEVVLEREPITEANAGAAGDGPAISEEEHEVVLHEEQVVVDKETVPVERVRMGTEQVTEQREVSEQVRKEQIETEGTGDRA